MFCHSALRSSKHLIEKHKSTFQTFIGNLMLTTKLYSVFIFLYSVLRNYLSELSSWSHEYPNYSSWFLSTLDFLSLNFYLNNHFLLTKLHLNNDFLLPNVYLMQINRKQCSRTVNSLFSKYVNSEYKSQVCNVIQQRPETVSMGDLLVVTLSIMLSLFDSHRQEEIPRNYKWIFSLTIYSNLQDIVIGTFSSYMFHMVQ